MEKNKGEEKIMARMFRFLLAAACITSLLVLEPKDVQAAEDPFTDLQAASETEEKILLEEGFETGEAGLWSGKDGAEITVGKENPKSGSYCMKISGRIAPASGAKLLVGNMLKENQLLTVSAYARYMQGPEKKRVQITLFCDGKYYVLGGSDLPIGEWGRITGSMIVPDDIALAGAELFFETPWTPEPLAEWDLMDIYVDDIRAALRPFSDISSYPSLKELYKDQFLFGVAVSDEVIRTSVYRNLIDQQFNSITMENEMKPAYILDEAASKADLAAHQERAALNFRSYESGMEYARWHKIAMRGHTLIWHSQTPDWFFYENYDTSGKLAGRELMLRRMEHYIRDVIAWTETNYPGVIYAWDVVNEAAADPWGENAGNLLRQEGSLWYQTIGDDFVQKAFAYARKYANEYAPDHKIKLFYNDYNEYFSVKRDRIVELLKPVKDAGNIDGVGMQSHFDTNLPLEGPDGYMTAVRTFRDQLGLELHVTELDIGIAKGHTEEGQGVYYQEFMEALLKEKKDGANITSVTLWGLSDELSWRPDGKCLLFQGNLSRKPAFMGVVNAAGRLHEEEQKPPSLEKILIGEASMPSIPPQTYTGKAVTPSITMTCNGKNLTEGVDYTISWQNNKKIGTAAAVIGGMGDYAGEAVINFAITVKKNQAYTAGNYKYKIINARTNGKGTVALTGVKDGAVKKNLKKIQVAAVVSIGGKEFKVTEIGPNAFAGCKKAASAVIGIHVGRIGEKAFFRCGKLKFIEIKTGKLTSKSIGRKAFWGIHAKAVIKAPKITAR